MGYRVRIAFNALHRLSAHLCLPVAAAALVGASPADAQVKETVLYSFSGGNDGAGPAAGVITDETGRYTERRPPAAPLATELSLS